MSNKKQVEISNDLSLNTTTSARPFVSCIICAYNAEKWVQQCVESIMNQTMENIEIIIVNNKSNDSTLQIIQMLAKQDPRILVVVQENIGGAGAANRGLGLARGEYVQLLDADDWIESTACQDQYDHAKKYDLDIVVCDYTEKNEMRNPEITRYVKGTIKDFGVQTGKKALEIIFRSQLMWFGWNKLIKTKLFDDVRYPLNLPGACDLVAIAEVIYLSNKIGYLKKSFANYRRHGASETCTNRGNKSRAYQGVLAANEVRLFLESKGDFDGYRAGYYNFLCTDQGRYIKGLLPENTENVDDFKKAKYFLAEAISHFVSSISILIPVYNVETNIKRCIESAINQTMDNIEIVIVNDGSTDNTLSIVQKLARKDPRIKIINQERKGISSARNVAIKIANGEYIQHLNGNDWIHPAACQNQFDYAKEHNLDMVITDYVEIDERGDKILKQGAACTDSMVISKEDTLKNLLTLAVDTSLYNKLIKKDLYNEISHPEYLSLGEGVATTPKLIHKAKKIGILKHTFIHHVGILDSELESRGYEIVLASNEIKTYLQQEGDFELYSSRYSMFFNNKIKPFFQLAIPSKVISIENYELAKEIILIEDNI